MSYGGHGGGGYGPPGGGYGPPGGGYGPPGGGYGPPGGFAPMPQNFPPGYVPDTGTAPLEGGVPWEQQGGSFLAKWWATLKACNSETRPFFAAAAQNEKGDAVFFSMVSGAVSGAFVGLIYMLIFGALSLGFALGLPAGGKGGSAMSSAFASGISLGVGILYAIFITIGSAMGAMIRPFLWGGLHHLLLMLLGGVGERKTFMHTVRVAAYAEGASMPWIWIPIAGPFIATYYGIKDLVVGYDETHRCGIGRALMVLFAPVICCCGCQGLMIAFGMLPALMKP